LIEDRFVNNKAVFRLLVFVPLSILLFSCATTTIYWIPIYQISSGGYDARTSIDPDTGIITNPVEGVCLAYYRAGTTGFVVYSNRLNLSLANKVVLKNNEIDEAESTGQVVGNLSLWKSFYYDPQLTSTEDSQRLYILKDGLLAALDHQQLREGQVVEYVLSGQNTGTDPLQAVTILDVLPAGFKVAATEYWFRKNESARFEHKILEEKGKEAVVFTAKLAEPLAIGDSFQIKVRIRLDLDTLPKEFY